MESVNRFVFNVYSKLYALGIIENNIQIEYNIILSINSILNFYSTHLILTDNRQYNSDLLL